MRGKIGSGKTHRAKEICAATGAQLLSTDSLTKKLFGDGCPGRETLVRAERAVLDYFLELAAENEKQGRATVIDHGFWLASDLAHAKGFLEMRGISVETVTMSADFETRLERVKNRTDGKSFDREKLARLDGYYEEN